MKEQPITIGFPLRGEWLAPTTPAEKIPSHGTDRMGLRYAFDFLQVNFEGKTKAFHDRSFLRYFFLGVPLESCYCWGEKSMRLVMAKSLLQEMAIGNGKSFTGSEIFRSL